MRLHPRFLPKVVSEFHINEVVHLLEFFPKPHGGRAEQRLHTLDIVLLGQDKTFQAISQIVSGFYRENQGSGGFCTEDLKLNCPVYQNMLAGKQLPHKVQATRVKSICVASLASLPISDICKAATWSSVHAFTKHYTVVQAALDDARFGRSVLQSIYRETPHICPE